MISTRSRPESGAVLTYEASDIGVVVRLHREEGPADAVEFARRGFRIVICMGSSADDEAKLKALAPTNFLIRAMTQGDLVKLLRASFG